MFGMESKRVNIAIAGGPCTGKSTLSAYVYAHLKLKEYDYDLILEECMKLKKEFGTFRTPFERFYMWRQQEREELRSNAQHGFITDKPLFHYYAQARQFAAEPRDDMAVREFFRMCLELNKRYQLIAIPENPLEIPYKTDQSRSSKMEISVARHKIIRTFVEHTWPEKLLLVHGSLEDRTKQVVEKASCLLSQEGFSPEINSPWLGKLDEEL